MKGQNFEEMYYSLYFAIIYGFELKGASAEDALKSDSCILMLLSYLYFKKIGNKREKNKLHDYAVELSKCNFDNYWLFVYEVLSVNYFKDEWLGLKKAKISFIDEEFSNLIQ